MWTTMTRHAALASLLLSAGCAATLPPSELVDARNAYSNAANGAAGRSDPADLETARQALVKAERAFNDQPDADATRDFAYLAGVKARTAEERGLRIERERAHADAEAQFKAIAESKIDSKNATIHNDAARIQATGVALSAERERRADLEKRLSDVMQRLSTLAAVKVEPRGTVITLSGSVLFASDKSDLLPSASDRLDDVAEALKAQPDRTVTVLGFTDSRGDVAYNQALSERRAESVRGYLIGRGVAAEQLTAVGKGPADPVADNSSAEGRANNRRVEIVISPAKDESVYP